MRRASPSREPGDGLECPASTKAPPRIPVGPLRTAQAPSNKRQATSIADNDHHGGSPLFSRDIDQLRGFLGSPLPPLHSPPLFHNSPRRTAVTSPAKLTHQRSTGADGFDPLIQSSSPALSKMLLSPNALGSNNLLDTPTNRGVHMRSDMFTPTARRSLPLEQLLTFTFLSDEGRHHGELPTRQQQPDQNSPRNARNGADGSANGSIGAGGVARAGDKADDITTNTAGGSQQPSAVVADSHARGPAAAARRLKLESLQGSGNLNGGVLGPSQGFGQGLTSTAAAGGGLVGALATTAGPSQFLIKDMLLPLGDSSTEASAGSAATGRPGSHWPPPSLSLEPPPPLRGLDPAWDRGSLWRQTGGGSSGSLPATLQTRQQQQPHCHQMVPTPTPLGSSSPGGQPPLQQQRWTQEQQPPQQQQRLLAGGGDVCGVSIKTEHVDANSGPTQGSSNPSSPPNPTEEQQMLPSAFATMSTLVPSPEDTTAAVVSSAHKQTATNHSKDANASSAGSTAAATANAPAPPATTTAGATTATETAAANDAAQPQHRNQSNTNNSGNAIPELPFTDSINGMLLQDLMPLLPRGFSSLGGGSSLGGADLLDGALLLGGGGLSCGMASVLDCEDVSAHERGQEHTKGCDDGSGKSRNMGVDQGGAPQVRQQQHDRSLLLSSLSQQGNQEAQDDRINPHVHNGSEGLILPPPLPLELIPSVGGGGLDGGNGGNGRSLRSFPSMAAMPGGGSTGMLLGDLLMIPTTDQQTAIHSQQQQVRLPAAAGRGGTAGLNNGGNDNNAIGVGDGHQRNQMMLFGAGGAGGQKDLAMGALIPDPRFVSGSGCTAPTTADRSLPPGLPPRSGGGPGGSGGGPQQPVVVHTTATTTAGGGGPPSSTPSTLQRPQRTRTANSLYGSCVVGYDMGASGRRASSEFDAALLAPSLSTETEPPPHLQQQHEEHIQLQRQQQLQQQQYQQQLPPSRAAPGGPGGRGRRASETNSKSCRCKKSQCLKLYCDCFAAGQYCGACSCVACHNRPEHADRVQQRREDISARDPQAFTRKIQHNGKHKRGCNCRRSHCLKKYCECYQGGVRCGIQCTCLECENMDTAVLEAPTGNTRAATKRGATGKATKGGGAGSRGGAVRRTSANGGGTASAADTSMASSPQLPTASGCSEGAGPSPAPSYDATAMMPCGMGGLMLPPSGANQTNRNNGNGNNYPQPMAVDSSAEGGMSGGMEGLVMSGGAAGMRMLGGHASGPLGMGGSGGGIMPFGTQPLPVGILQLSSLSQQQHLDDMQLPSSLALSPSRPYGQQPLTRAQSQQQPSRLQSSQQHQQEGQLGSQQQEGNAACGGRVEDGGSRGHDDDSAEEEEEDEAEEKGGQQSRNQRRRREGMGPATAVTQGQGAAPNITAAAAAEAPGGSLASQHQQQQHRRDTPRHMFLSDGGCSADLVVSPPALAILAQSNLFTFDSDDDEDDGKYGHGALTVHNGGGDPMDVDRRGNNVRDRPMGRQPHGRATAGEPLSATAAAVAGMDFNVDSALADAMIAAIAGEAAAAAGGGGNGGAPPCIGGTADRPSWLQQRRDETGDLSQGGDGGGGGGHQGLARRSGGTGDGSATTTTDGDATAAAAGASSPSRASTQAGAGGNGGGGLGVGSLLCGEMLSAGLLGDEDEDDGTVEGHQRSRHQQEAFFMPSLASPRAGQQQGYLTSHSGLLHGVVGLHGGFHQQAGHSLLSLSPMQQGPAGRNWQQHQPSLLTHGPSRFAPRSSDMLPAACDAGLPLSLSSPTSLVELGADCWGAGAAAASVHTLVSPVRTSATMRRASSASPVKGKTGACVATGVEAAGNGEIADASRQPGLGPADHGATAVTTVIKEEEETDGGDANPLMQDNWLSFGTTSASLDPTTCMRQQPLPPALPSSGLCTGLTSTGAVSTAPLGPRGAAAAVGAAATAGAQPGTTTTTTARGGGAGTRGGRGSSRGRNSAAERELLKASALQYMTQRLGGGGGGGATASAGGGVARLQSQLEAEGGSCLMSSSGSGAFGIALASGGGSNNFTSAVIATTTNTLDRHSSLPLPHLPLQQQQQQALHAPLPSSSSAPLRRVPSAPAPAGATIMLGGTGGANQQAPVSSIPQDPQHPHQDVAGDSSMSSGHGQTNKAAGAAGNGDGSAASDPVAGAPPSGGGGGGTSDVGSGGAAAAVGSGGGGGAGGGMSRLGSASLVRTASGPTVPATTTGAVHEQPSGTQQQQQPPCTQAPRPQLHTGAVRIGSMTKLGSGSTMFFGPQQPKVVGL